MAALHRVPSFCHLLLAVGAAKANARRLAALMPKIV
jgi:hypothetical protein